MNNTSQIAYRLAEIDASIQRQAQRIDGLGARLDPKRGPKLREPSPVKADPTDAGRQSAQAVDLLAQIRDVLLDRFESVDGHAQQINESLLAQRDALDVLRQRIEVTNERIEALGRRVHESDTTASTARRGRG